MQGQEPLSWKSLGWLGTTWASRPGGKILWLFAFTWDGPYIAPSTLKASICHIRIANLAATKIMHLYVMVQTTEAQNYLNDPFLGRFPMLLWVREIWLLPTTLPYRSLIHMLTKSLQQDKAMTHEHYSPSCSGDHLASIALLLSMHCKH